MPTHTVVYDGHCRVCRRMVEALARWDRENALELVASQEPGVRERFPWIAPESYEDALQLVAANGTTWDGALAVERIIGLMPRGRLVTWLFDLPFARWLADRFYRWFARNRYRMGCGDHCSVRR
ncbi:MAG TPA: DUF393 domain-containing protein [Vicinamibacteria bacterium]|jgi:predicted DCC family thiol-disulfide oxidoreductase YuxK